MQERISSGVRIVLLDVRSALGMTDGFERYLEGHLPGAVYVDLGRELASQGAPEKGRNPLPDRESLQRAARRWGINEGDTVVAYDHVGAVSAARAWWSLRDAGHEQVHLLDGGLSAWRNAGFPVQSGDVVPAPGNVKLSAGQMPQLTMEQAGRFPADGVLLDARPADRFRSENETVDPRPGHIPGARSLPALDNLTANRTFQSVEDIRRRFAKAGVVGNVPVAVYCGSGVAAAHAVAAAELAGIPAALYPGSWSQWSNHPQLPAAIGSE